MNINTLLWIIAIIEIIVSIGVIYYTNKDLSKYQNRGV